MTLGFLKQLFAPADSRHPSGETRRADRTILLVANLSRDQDTLRVISIEERWHLLIAPRLEVAHVYLSRASVSVILYDQDLPGISWRTGAQSLLHHSDPACLILLSFVADDRLRRSVLHIGGYDVAEKPLRRSNLVPLVNGYCLLRKNIDSL